MYLPEKSVKTKNATVHSLIRHTCMQGRGELSCLRQHARSMEEDLEQIAEPQEKLAYDKQLLRVKR